MPCGAIIKQNKLQFSFTTRMKTLFDYFFCFNFEIFWFLIKTFYYNHPFGNEDAYTVRITKSLPGQKFNKIL